MSDYCCSSMDDLVKAVGGKGISAIIEGVEGDYKLRIQFRVGTASQLERLTPALGSLSEEVRQEIGSIGLEWQLGIRYCPWCGSSLSHWISDHKGLVEKLAEQHKSLVLGQ